jgi:hypothetical protein
MPAAMSTKRRAQWFLINLPIASCVETTEENGRTSEIVQDQGSLKIWTVIQGMLEGSFEVSSVSCAK